MEKLHLPEVLAWHFFEKHPAIIEHSTALMAISLPPIDYQLILRYIGAIFSIKNDDQ
jgi:hypothetical protein